MCGGGGKKRASLALSCFTPKKKCYPGVKFAWGGITPPLKSYGRGRGVNTPVINCRGGE